MKRSHKRNNFIMISHISLMLLLIIMSFLMFSCSNTTHHNEEQVYENMEHVTNETHEDIIEQIIDEAKHRIVHETREKLIVESSNKRKRERVVVETIEPSVEDTDIVEPTEEVVKKIEDMTFDKFEFLTHMSEKDNYDCNIVLDVPVYKDGLEQDRLAINNALKDIGENIISDLVSTFDSIEYNESEEELDYPNSVMLKRPTIEQDKKLYTFTYEGSVNFPLSNRVVPITIIVNYDVNDQTSHYYISHFNY